MDNRLGDERHSHEPCLPADDEAETCRRLEVYSGLEDLQGRRLARLHNFACEIFSVIRGVQETLQEPSGNV